MTKKAIGHARPPYLIVDRVERRVQRLEPVFSIRMKVEQIVDGISREYERPAREILGKGRGRRQAELRAIVGYVGREIGGLKLAQAAKIFARDISALSIGVKSLEGKMLKDRRFRERVQRLCASLVRERTRKYSTTQA
ncbi:MAG: hypothetical protein ACE5HC_01405 [Candidatus Binatia bacterium]